MKDRWSSVTVMTVMTVFLFVFQRRDLIKKSWRWRMRKLDGWLAGSRCVLYACSLLHVRFEGTAIRSAVKWYLT